MISDMATTITSAVALSLSGVLTRAAEVLARLHIPIHAIDAHGIQIVRQGPYSEGNGPWDKEVVPGTWHRSELRVWTAQVWRISPGGGIAGNGQAWILAPLRTADGERAWPRCTTIRDLTRTLRRWRRWETAPR